MGHHGRLYVRIAYTDSLGKKRELMRRAQDRRHARELKKQLVQRLDSTSENSGMAIAPSQKNSLGRLMPWNITPKPQQTFPFDVLFGGKRITVVGLRETGLA